ncbi:MAG TPA: protein kinase [Trebonia sp.]
MGRLGAGEMGRVFLGESRGGRLAAVKVIRQELADEPGFRERFAREVTAARNVGGGLFTARVVDADPDAPAPWLATAYVAGPSLAEAVAEHGPLPAPTVATLAAGLAEGLAAIHVTGVVHRNLKPANVLLAGDGPRVVDFGISRAVDTSMLAKTGMIMGSPGFMSPEQVNAEDARPPSDIFSLGAVLTFAAAGQGPFGTGPTPALVYRVLAREPDLARVPEELRALVGWCLCKDPGGRPTAEDLLTELGSGRLAVGWLPRQVAATMDRYSVSAGKGNRVVSGTGNHGAPGYTAEPSGAGHHRPGGSRRRRLVTAAAVAVLLAAAGSTAYALNASETVRPVADPLARVTTRAGATVPTRASSPATVPAPARTAAGKRVRRPSPSSYPTAVAMATATASGGGPVAPTSSHSAPPTPKDSAMPGPTGPASPATPARPIRRATAVVPGVEGDGLSAAESALNAAGLHNYSAAYDCFDSRDADAVVTQAPAAGTRVALTAPVQLGLQADDCVTVPSVVGLRPARAKSILYALGFAPADITSRFECDGVQPVNQVEAQSPAAGTSYPTDQPVSLDVEADDCR